IMISFIIRFKSNIEFGPIHLPLKTSSKSERALGVLAIQEMMRKNRNTQDVLARQYFRDYNKSHVIMQLNKYGFYCDNYYDYQSHTDYWICFAIDSPGLSVFRTYSLTLTSFKTTKSQECLSDIQNTYQNMSDLFRKRVAKRIE